MLFKNLTIVFETEGVDIEKRISTICHAREGGHPGGIKPMHISSGFPFCPASLGHSVRD